MKKILIFLCLLIVLVIVVACSDEQDPNVLKISNSSDDIVGENFETVISELKATGFTNVETVVMDDLITGWLTKDGEVEKIEVNGEAKFSAKEQFQKDSEIVITYHTFSADDENEKAADDEKSSDQVEESTQETTVEETDEDTSDKDKSDKEENDGTADEETTEKSKAESTQQIITAENNEELAALLAVKDEYDPIIIEFSKKYAGRTIEIDASIVNIMNHGSANTRYDILMLSGDYSETDFSGPNLKFEDVNMSDLNLKGNVPESLVMGQNLRITAVVEEFDENMGILFLTPTITEIR